MIKMKKVSVLLPSNTNSTYDYLSPSSLELGTLVSVPFRNKEMKGIVWYDSSEDIPFEKLKKVKKVFNEIKLEKKFDHIFINGAIDQFPFYLTKYLKKDGKIYSIYTENDFPSYFCKFTLKNNDEYEKTQLFEASAPLLYNLKSNQVKFIF